VSDVKVPANSPRTPTPTEYRELWLAMLLGRLPPAWASAVGAWLGAQRGRRGIAAKRLWVERLDRNLDRLGAPLPPGGRDQRVIAYTSRIGRLYAEYPVLHKLAREGRLELVGRGHLTDLPRPAILVSCHLANWELVGHVLALLDAPASALHDPPENPVRRRLAARARLGWLPDSQLIPPSPQALRQLCRALANGRNLLLYIDEVRDGHLWAPSLGRCLPERGNLWLAARLAVRYRADLLPVHVERVGAARFRIVISPKLAPPGGGEAERTRSLADQLDQWLETQVRAHPEHWYGLWEVDLAVPLPR